MVSLSLTRLPIQRCGWRRLVRCSSPALWVWVPCSVTPLFCSKDDVVLNSITACFTNEFAEVVLGGAIIIPIAVGYYGIENVIGMTQSGGMGLGFKVLPYLFCPMGTRMVRHCRFCLFGLLFSFVSLPSSPFVPLPLNSLNENYSVSRVRSSILFSVVLTLVGLPIVFFFNQGVFDEFDFWGGTISLFVFGMIEAILFCWVMGMDKGWTMINNNANMKLPMAYKYVMKYVTPTMLIIIFVAALIKPANDDWSQLSLKGWKLDNSAVLAELRHQGIGPNSTWTAPAFYSENAGRSILTYESGKFQIKVDDQTYTVQKGCQVAVAEGAYVKWELRSIRAM